MRTTIWALLSAAVAVPVSAQQPSPAGIAGEWTYNAADSDKAREFMPRMGADSGGRPAQRPAGPPPGGMPGGGGRGGGGSGPPGGGFGPPGGAGGRGPGGSRMNEEVRARMRQTMQLALAAPRTLRISLADSMLWIGRDSVTEPLRLKMDGKKNKLEPAGDGEGEVEVRARLREGALGAEWSVKGGGKFEESYFLTSDRRQLVVLLELEMGGGGEPVRFRRLYDRAAQAVAPLTPSP